MIPTFGPVLAALLSLTWAGGAAAAPKKHFDVEAGDATLMLNEFSRQADLQVLFDFSLLKGFQTHAVAGEFDPSVALTSMLDGTGLQFEFVNPRTLAVTPLKTNTLARAAARLRSWWHRSARPPAPDSGPEGLEQVLIAAHPEHERPPVGAAVIHLSRIDIERSGFATTQDFIRTLPQVFGGGPSEDTQLIGREASTNSSKGSGINLRGLDAGATLVLINGRRIAPSGTDGAFSDISNIPLSAADHIDVLPEGASARYGADAIGGVVNVVMRSDFTGAETQARAGTVTSGSLGERQFSQLLGSRWESGNGMLGLEYYNRDALRARDRRQQHSDLRPFGGDNFDVPYGSPGTITVGGQTWAIPKGQNGTSLTAAQLIPGTKNLYDQFSGADALPSQERWSLFGSARNEVRRSLEVFVEGLYTNRRMAITESYGVPLPLLVPSTNPFYVNPGGGTGPVAVMYGSAAEFGQSASVTRLSSGNVAVGFSMAVARAWTLKGSVGHTFEKQRQVTPGLVDTAALNAALADPNPATAFNPFGDGSHTNPATLAAIARTGLFTLDSNIRVASLTADGPVLAMPGGDLRIALGTEYRDQSFNTYLWQTSTIDSRLGRRVASAFSEILVPIVGPDNSRPLIQRMDLSFGARYENYSDVGGAGIPKFGIAWAPTPGIVVRGTWTKSFKAPNLTDLVAKNSASNLFTLPDSTSPSRTTTVLGAFGKNPDLQPERARSWTLGAELTPVWLPGLSLGLTYFDIKYEGRIDNAQIGQDVLQRPDLAWLVTRNTTFAERSAICSSTTFIGAPGACLSAPIGAIIDNRLHNIAMLKTRGIDVLGDYSFGSAPGQFKLGLNGTYLFDYSQIKSPGSPVRELLSTQNNPIDLRLRGSISWERHGFGLSTYVNYDDSYRDTASVPNRKVNSWTTVDLRLSYQNDRNDLAGLGHAQFALSAQNVFNTNPPFLNNHIGMGYDQENADLLGRVVSLEIRKRW